MKLNEFQQRIRCFLSICKRPIKILIGAITYIHLMSRDKCTHYVILPLALGDSICALVYLKEYKKQQGYEHVTIVCTKSVKRVCDFWKDTFEDLICVDKNIIKGLLEVPHTIWGQQLYAFDHRDRITFAYHFCNMIQRNYWWNKYYDLNQFVKDLVFQIAPDSKMQYPKIPYINIQNLIEKYDIKRDKTVLLNPYANSIKCNVFALFGDVVDVLVRKGYRVVTLTSNEKDMPIEGTQPLHCTLVEAYWLAEYSGTIIALRSGFLDLMVFARCKIISIVDKNYGPKDFYQLEKWGVNQECYTIEYSNNDKEVIQQIKDVMHLDIDKEQ